MSDANGPTFIATSTKPSISIRPEDLGPPGSHSCISIVPQFLGRRASNEDILNDTTKRQFIVAARLSKGPSIIGQDQNIKGDFGHQDGSSYLVAPPDSSRIRIDTLLGCFFLNKNNDRELSMIEFECAATTPLEARMMFMETVHPALDHLSYAHNAPVFVSTIRVFDIAHQATHIMAVSPYRHQIVSDSLNELFVEMRPIYAMYREAKNSPSDFYKFLCLYKIMEGLLGLMRSSAYERARTLEITLDQQRLVVPADPIVPSDLQEHVGTPIKKFFDRVLTLQFRNAVAHLQTEGGVLDVSSPAELERFAGLALVTDVCARELIKSHEQILAQLKP